MINWIQTHIPPWVFIAVVAHLAILGTVAYLILLERKIASWAQDRIGPNRVGPKGLLQPLADGLKFILKEDYSPGGVDRVLFSLAPVIFIAVIIVSIAVIPWAGTHQTSATFDLGAPWTEFQAGPIGAESADFARAEAAVPVNSEAVAVSEARLVDGRVMADITYQYPFQIAKLNIGLLFLVAVLSLAVYGIVLGGWASNNKYSFLGSLRATAQMVSYEIPLGISILTVALMFGTLELGEIVNRQAHYWYGIPAWNVFCQPAAFLMFLICIHAEANRAPFDLAEAEQELVGGYHTEYSSMRFALFFLAEYAGMITTSAICVALFFGGWHFPGLNGDNWRSPEVTDSWLVIALRCLVFFVKVLAVIGIFMWVRWSLPRFRFDQLMMLAWRALIPLSLAVLLGTAIVLYFMAPGDPYFKEHRWMTGRMALVLLGMNVVVVIGMVVVSLLIPAAPETNRRMKIAGSRYEKTPLPAGVS